MMSLTALTLPQSSATVEVSIIDTTTWIGNMPAGIAMSPVYPGLETFAGPSYSFLIRHQKSNTCLLFDLGIRKDWETKLSPEYREIIRTIGTRITVESDVADILVTQAIDLKSINAIIFSHHHFDHTGDTTKFPPTTSIVVGSDFKATFLPGWPTGSAATGVTADLFEGRDIREINFSREDSRCSRIGEFRAYDYFGDGSFYILDTPGHTVGHISALARTTAATDGESSTFIFMGGDIAHHNAVFRPSEICPLPTEIDPSPYAAPFSQSAAPCPGEIFASIHYMRNHTDGAHKCRTLPFGRVAGPDYDVEEAQRSVDKLMAFDGLDNVLTVYAHDQSLMSVVDFFPKPATNWKVNGWGKEGHWRFLTAFVPAVEDDEPGQAA